MEQRLFVSVNPFHARHVRELFKRLIARQAHKTPLNLSIYMMSVPSLYTTRKPFRGLRCSCLLGRQKCTLVIPISSSRNDTLDILMRLPPKQFRPRYTNNPYAAFQKQFRRGCHGRSCAAPPKRLRNLSNPKPGHTTGGSGRGARRGGLAGSTRLGANRTICLGNKSIS